jgi:hypothetical protein
LNHPLLENLRKLPAQPLTEHESPTEAPMKILGGLSSCLARVNIAPPKLNCSSGRFLLNPNETMAPRAPQNERSNHNVKEEGYPSIYPFYVPSRSFPFLTKSNPHFIFPPISFNCNYLFLFCVTLGFVIILT